MTNIISQAVKRLFANGQNQSKGSRMRCESRDDYDQRFQMTLREWLLYHQKDVIFDDCKWMGVRSLKNPLDAWVYQEIIYEVKPDVIIEIGSYAGGGTLFFAHMLDLIGNGMVVSVDIDRSHYNVEHPRITTVTGNSSSEEVVSKVASLCKDKKVMLLHDGDHNKAQVLLDLKAYSGLVSKGSYILVEDGVVDLFDAGDGMALTGDGPLAAVEEFLRTNSDFEIDESKERYILTYNPKGFLRRVN